MLRMGSEVGVGFCSSADGLLIEALLDIVFPSG